ncbi:tetratricopeptide repeat protein [Streptomyces paludis]|uniref:Tetratricopeptide repeat protein n=1 Tax=Streptomyces paludis TaxID=2282738 RepID=A0A345HU40_9ACTN|nr:tetratricopeptide repeat protein [Streptomyces paludis]AXG80214.1 tetratricopeptide repeat protein [Streptomyces paludis]
MTTDLAPEDIRRALWENESAPNGLPRNARAEQLVTAAEATGDPDVLRTALFGLIKAYEYSTERGKMLVPFARLLQEWDRDPSAFDEGDTHTFHWMFKWASSGMLTLPEMPLTTVEKWLAEMERRYRAAGYTERAVRQAEFNLADSTGDEERAARAFAAWSAAERDRMANCHACELNDQGTYWAERGDDEKALRTWEPVLAGRSHCAEEPHRVLARSLLPLLRSGRTDEARTHHLRGYRLARGNESLLGSIGRHIEFCALTGNEGRGLEILAEHAAQLEAEGNPSGRLELLGGTLVLLRRLLALGLGERPAVPDRVAGERRTVRELHDLLDAEATETAARFDRRNGNGTKSAELAARLAAQPLLAALPLGVRAPRIGPAAIRPETVRAETVRAGTVRPAETPGAEPERAETAGPAALAALAARARELRAKGHPGALAAWDRLAALVAEDDAAVDPLLAAELLEHTAVRAGRAGEDTVRDLFREAAAAHRAAGEHSRAALNDLRVVYAAARTGTSSEEIRELLATADEAARALDPADPTRTRRIATVALSEARLGGLLRHLESGHGAGEGADEGADEVADEGTDEGALLDAELAAFIAEFSVAETAGETVEETAGETAEGLTSLADLLAEAEVLRAEHAWQTGDGEAADALFASAVRRSVAAGRPWDAAEPLAQRARLLMAMGRAEDAEAAARTALEHGAELTGPAELGGLRLTLADLLYQQYGKEDEAAEYALEAAHWFDEAGESAGPGAYSRLILAQAYSETGRPAEAAEVLESALPDLLEHGPEQTVRARQTLGRALRAMNDQRAAAEQYLLAADIAKDWQSQHPHAQLATLGAECLSGAGLRTEAIAAYHRAVELWQSLAEPVGAVRALRSVAWLEAGEGDTAAARALMDRALAAGEGEGGELLLERASTWLQTAEILLNSLYSEADSTFQPPAVADPVRHEALGLLTQAEAALATLDLPGVVSERARCATRMAWTEQELDRAESATARLRALIAELTAQDTEECHAVLPRLERTLKQLSRRT